MLQSHVIGVDRVLVGAAILIDRGYRFVATDFRLEEAGPAIWPTLVDVRGLARRICLTGSSAENTMQQTLAGTHPVKIRES
jgi:hypothetical protein